MPPFRVSIDTGPDGLSEAVRRALESDGFALLDHGVLERPEVATWVAAKDPPTPPGWRYFYVVDAEDETQADERTRAIVGADTNIRVAPHRAT